MGDEELRPTDVNANSVEIPLTLDVQASAQYLTKNKIQFGFLIAIAIIIAAIVIAIVFHTIPVMLMCILGAIIGITILRYFWFEEKKYKKYYNTLNNCDNVFDSTLFWEIYEVAENYPICYYKNGLKALFVMFDKDIVIGRGTDGAYNHYEALTQAYRQLSRRGIKFIHIDYMDTVGRDTRLDGVIKDLLKTPNAMLRKVLATVFTYQKHLMSATNTSYDVYAFYFTGDDKVFRDNMDAILPLFLKANFVRYRLLTLENLRVLASTLYGLDNFSAKVACEKVFENNNKIRKSLKVISYVKGGVETKVNKTREDLEQEQHMQAIAKQTKKQAPKLKRTAKKMSNNTEDVDLWS